VLRGFGASSIVVLECGLVVAAAVTLLVVRSAPRLGFTLLADVIEETLDLVPARAAELVSRVCGPAYARFSEATS
jgi:hypothetical protein